MPHHLAWYVRAQLAGSQPDYLATARKGLVDLGVPADTLDAFVADPSSVEGAGIGVKPNGVQPAVWFDALLEFLNAWQASSGKFEPGPEEQAEIVDARERIFLERLAKRFRASLKRADLLDAVPFEEAYLHEAAECYLFGFFRATVMLAGAGLERALVERLRAPERTPAEALVAQAAERGFIDEAGKAQAERVVWLRNRVAHDGYVPEDSDASFALDHARSLVGQLRS